MKVWLKENSHLVLVTALVLGLAYPTYSDLASYERQEALAALTEPTRAPASVPPTQIAAHTVADPVVEWNCGDTGVVRKEMDSVSGVRLKIGSCRSNAIRTVLDVKNETNGFAATVFALSKARFETDLIALSPGSNKISLKYIDLKGRTLVQVIELLSRAE